VYKSEASGGTRRWSPSGVCGSESISGDVETMLRLAAAVGKRNADGGAD
jgi:hypothetical protein